MWINKKFELRRNAKKNRKDFKIKQLHGLILMHGALPLNILE